MSGTKASTLVLLRRLWREYLAAWRGRIVQIALVTMVMAGATALYPALIDQAVAMFTRRDLRIFYQIPLLVLAVTMVKAAAQYGQSVLLQKFVLGVIRDLQNGMFAHLVHADLARLERETPAQLTARFTTDAALIRESLSRAMNGAADALTVLGLIGTMVYLDWMLSLIAAAFYPLAVLPIQSLGRRVRRASEQMQERTGETASFLNESFAQARVVRAYRLEEAETARAATAFARLYRALYRLSRMRARVEPLLEVLAGIAVALVLGFVGWRAAIGTAKLGNFTGFVAALLIASRPVRALGTMNTALQEGLAGLARVFAVIDEKPGIVEFPGAQPLPAGPGMVAFRDVCFSYPDGRKALDGLSFIARPGKTLAFVGPSGAGKSTALALIPRLADVTSGAIEIDGADVRSVTLASLRDAIAYVAQDQLLFDDSVTANIRLGQCGATAEEITQAAAAADADQFIASLPEGFATIVGPGGQRLSGGQRQRIALARALLRQPRILLLDEAISGLDAESEAAVRKALTRLRRGRTTIIVAHRLSTVRDADLVVAIADGCAVEAGSHTELMACGGLYARLVHTQMLVP